MPELNCQLHASNLVNVYTTARYPSRFTNPESDSLECSLFNWNTVPKPRPSCTLLFLLYRIVNEKATLILGRSEVFVFIYTT